MTPTSFNLGAIRSIGILPALLVAGCTTPGKHVYSDEAVFSELPHIARGNETLAVFVNSHTPCVLDECASRGEIQKRVATCLATGMRRVHPGFRAISGEQELPIDTSALTADPRVQGTPDPRIDAELASRFSNQQINYVLIVDISRATTRKEYQRRMGPNGPAPVPEGWRTTIETHASVILVEAVSGKWIGRVRRSFTGSTAGSPFFPLAWLTFTSADADACESAGAGIAVLLRGGVPAVRRDYFPPERPQGQP